jgi:DNA replication protein DnaC
MLHATRLILVGRDRWARRSENRTPSGPSLPAQAAHRLQVELKKYLAPTVLVLDEVGYLPHDKAGADLLFQIVSQRYERGSIIVTTNKAYKHWAGIFNNDAGITAAILDQLLHRATTVVIEGSSYRMKDRNPEEPVA